MAHPQVTPEQLKQVLTDTLSPHADVRRTGKILRIFGGCEN